jgi:hypothetical protein
MVYASVRTALRTHDPTQEKGNWWPGWKSEIYSICKGLNIMDDTKSED